MFTANMPCCHSIIAFNHVLWCNQGSLDIPKACHHVRSMSETTDISNVQHGLEVYNFRCQVLHLSVSLDQWNWNRQMTRITSMIMIYDTLLFSCLPPLFQLTYHHICSRLPFLFFLLARHRSSSLFLCCVTSKLSFWIMHYSHIMFSWSDLIFFIFKVNLFRSPALV